MQWMTYTSEPAHDRLVLPLAQPPRYIHTLASDSCMLFDQTCYETSMYQPIAPWSSLQLDVSSSQISIAEWLCRGRQQCGWIASTEIFLMHMLYGLISYKRFLKPWSHRHLDLYGRQSCISGVLQCEHRARWIRSRMEAEGWGPSFE